MLSYSLCVIGLFCLFKFRWLILSVFIYTYLLVCKGVFLGWDISHMDRRFFVYFLAGMSAWLWRDKIPLHWLIAAAASALATISYFTATGLLVEPFATTYLVLWLAYSKTSKVSQWCDSADLSYGVYLYAFPVQQLIATTAWGRSSWVMLAVAVPVTIGLSH